MIRLVRGYHRLQVRGELGAPAEPTLFLSNHGFGSIFDLNVLTALAAIEDMRRDRPLTILVHQIAWTVGLGPLLERLDAVAASRGAARRAFADGHDVLVFPGGDIDAFKPHRDRDRILFGGRDGFAAIAMECGAPIVPIVTAGTGDTLYALPGGETVARTLRLDELLRLKSLPSSVSIPWGFNVGLVGFAPYLPLPVRLTTEALPAMAPEDSETAAAFAERITEAMQRALLRNSRSSSPHH